ncbi:MAG TPA: AmmeMemoRadiSam system protein B [Bryobacteraceae bacterium]|jgi:AmmeMemoRadiSam system protein B|nr:AmmeMemoRadiSam system protein B [Bryobacteraceae bacterium]
MANELPRLRLGLDFLPSQDAERPGLLIRDPYRYSDSVLLIPPQLVASLACFDGEQTTLDLRSSLVHATGEIQVGDLEKHLTETLSQAGFLEDARFVEMRDARQREFRAAAAREPSHAGAAYPGDAAAVRKELDGYLEGAGPDGKSSLLGIAAPHVSPFGGWQCYRDAYGPLSPSYGDRTFVILGTSHYGEPNRFGLTRKSFITPLGEAQTDVDLVDLLSSRAPEATRMEDYCHAIEHSIEFQVLFLQHRFGPSVRIVPILCGAYARSILQGGMPEDDPQVARFIGALGDLAAARAGQLFWVLGVDMAHMGRRYGDAFNARANQGEMTSVARRDTARIDAVNAGDSKAFWDQVQEGQDDLKWCGSSPLYTFLKAVPEARGTLERYDQWNIDNQSVVSFAALQFQRR